MNMAIASATAATQSMSAILLRARVGGLGFSSLIAHMALTCQAGLGGLVGLSAFIRVGVGRKYEHR